MIGGGRSNCQESKSLAAEQRPRVSVMRHIRNRVGQTDEESPQDGHILQHSVSNRRSDSADRGSRVHANVRWRPRWGDRTTWWRHKYCDGAIYSSEHVVIVKACLATEANGSLTRIMNSTRHGKLNDALQLYAKRYAVLSKTDGIRTTNASMRLSDSRQQSLRSQHQIAVINFRVSSWKAKPWLELFGKSFKIGILCSCT